MAKIQIQDLPGDMSISYEEMRKIHGGIRFTIDTDDLYDRYCNLVQQTMGALHSYASSSSSSSSSSSGGGGGTKPSSPAIMETK